MKTTTLAVLLSAISLGGVAMLYVKVDDLSEQLRLSRSDRAGSRSDVAAAERPEYVIRGDADGSSTTASNGTGDGADAGGAEAAPGKPATVEERLARLERKEAERGNARAWSAPVFRTQRFARNVDELGSQLKLTANQKDRVRSAIERGKARIEDVLSIPGPDGKSIKQIREENRKRLHEAITDPEKNAGALVTLAMSGHKRMNEKIPGRNETYRQEVDRIKKETRDEIGGVLSPEQQEQFADTQIDPMLGESGGMAFSTSITMAGPDGDSSESAGMVIAEHVVETDEDSASDKKEK